MVMADKSMVRNAVRPAKNKNEGDNNDWENEENKENKGNEENEENEENEDNDENDENCNDAEFEAINAQLDQLNSVLDNLEQKNDDIRAELIQLLHSNREARKQFQECQDSLKPDL